MSTDKVYPYTHTFCNEECPGHISTFTYFDCSGKSHYVRTENFKKWDDTLKAWVKDVYPNSIIFCNDKCGGHNDIVGTCDDTMYKNWLVYIKTGEGVRIDYVNK